MLGVTRKGYQSGAVCSAVVDAEPVAGLSTNVYLCSGSGDASVSSLLLFGLRMSGSVLAPWGQQTGLVPAAPE